MHRIMVDAYRCDGCMECVAACERRQEKPAPADVMTGETRHSACFVRKNRQGQFVPNFCRQCSSPACLVTCMSGAIQQDPKTSHMHYDKERCAACYMCVMNCPYGMPKPDIITNKSVVKCNYCGDIEEIPDCAAACKTGAIYIAEVE